ncbi:hypothetical protein [Streptomyces sp. H27-C3]|uniref:hypothetical protein n=1 Tax=Streptomyces sp. H27-C3 TaxID=3046305 RepID=UPI0024B9C8B5|nr:hypothetical protein [Streptomyces sp. H27-C3]MDJ0465057.1 hypothetical protein [Streptomyces sp. H27-C3]
MTSTDTTPSPGGLLLPPEEGAKMYLQRVARLALADAPGDPLYSLGQAPHTLTVIHHHAGRCDQSRKRIAEHAANREAWTQLLEAVGFSVRLGRSCGVIGTLETPPTEAGVEQYGEVQDFTEQVTFPAHGVGGLVQKSFGHTGFRGCVVTSSTGQQAASTKTADQGVVSLALHWGLPHHVTIVRS